MAAEVVTDQDELQYTLYLALLNRMNVTWQPDEKMEQNIRNAMEEAAGYLRKIAGNPEITFYEGDLRSLFIACAWYFVENKRAEFEQEYSGDLIALRLEEGFGCGKERDDEV